MSKISYKDAGVNIDAGNDVVDRIKENVKSTFTKNVLTGIGSFGSLFSLKTILKEYSNPVLVQSIDGVGTKTIIAETNAEILQISKSNSLMKLPLIIVPKCAIIIPKDSSFEAEEMVLALSLIIEKTFDKAN